MTESTTSQWRLMAVRTISGQIEVLTGLRIGANVETMEISGLDNPILRNPANGEPYIPGSSLKGKLRSLAEWYLNELPLPSGDLVRDCKTDSRTAAVFGISASKTGHIGPTRTIVRDAQLSEDARNLFSQGKPITEIKTENSINRLTSMANPRPLERVVPGVRFDFQIMYRVFGHDGDEGRRDEENFEPVLLTAMRLLETDYLGSAGSRGCGQVRFLVPDSDGSLKPGVLVDGRHRELPELDWPEAGA